MIPFIYSHLTLCFIAAFAVIILGDIVARFDGKGSAALSFTIIIIVMSICSLAGFAIVTADGLTGFTVNAIVSFIFGAVATFTLAITERGLRCLVIRISERIRERTLRNYVEVKHLRAAIQSQLHECEEDLHYYNSGHPVDESYLKGKKIAYEDALHYIDYIFHLNS